MNETVRILRKKIVSIAVGLALPGLLASCLPSSTTSYAEDPFSNLYGKYSPEKLQYVAEATSFSYLTSTEQVGDTVEYRIYSIGGEKTVYNRDITDNYRCYDGRFSISSSNTVDLSPRIKEKYCGDLNSIVDRMSLKDKMAIEEIHLIEADPDRHRFAMNSKLAADGVSIRILIDSARSNYQNVSVVSNEFFHVRTAVQSRQAHDNFVSIYRELASSLYAHCTASALEANEDRAARLHRVSDVTKRLDTNNVKDILKGSLSLYEDSQSDIETKRSSERFLYVFADDLIISDRTEYEIFQMEKCDSEEILERTRSYVLSLT